MRTAFFLATLALVLPSGVNAACSQVQSSIAEQFQFSQVVARLNYTSESITLPCGVDVYDESTMMYIVEDTVSAYQVLEVFKGNLSGVDSLPLLLLTDAGFRVNLEERFQQEEEGFLAFLFPNRRCFDPVEGLTPYPDDYEPVPYSISSCIGANAPWPEVSEEDRQFLQSQIAGGDVDATSTTAPVVATKPPTEPPVGAPSSLTEQGASQLTSTSGSWTLSYGRGSVLLLASVAVLSLS